MKTIFAVFFLTCFDIFDIKEYAMFESYNEAQEEFNRIKKILYYTLSDCKPTRNETELFEIDDCMVTIKEIEIGKHIDLTRYVFPWSRHKEYPLVSVSYDANAAEDDWIAELYDGYYHYDDDEVAAEAKQEMFELKCLDLEDKITKTYRRYDFVIPEKYKRYL